jgi:hypothetical protein
MNRVIAGPGRGRHKRCITASGLLLSLACLFPPGLAARVFTHVYQSTVAEPGEREYAQWLTWKTHPRVDPSFDRYDFRHEFEFGINERWQAAFYLPDWRYEHGDSVKDEGSRFLDVGVETIYQLRNPGTGPYGLAVYGEMRVGNEVAALEPKLIVEKIAGPWILAWNGTLEVEWDLEHDDRRAAVLEQSFGLSREWHPGLRYGLELVHEIEYEDFSDRLPSLAYLGPNLHYAGDEWWLTATPMAQLTSVDGESRYQLRAILGFEFE